MTIVEAFRESIAFFYEMKAEGIIRDYALIGGLALSAWLRPRTTRDVDLVVVLSKTVSWSHLVSFLETRLKKKIAMQKGSARTNIKEKLSFVLGQIEVDVISAQGFDLAAEAVKAAVPVEVFGAQVNVATPEYLILLKLLPLSEQDAVDIKSLLKKADKSKVATLAKKHFLQQKLESIRGRRER